MTEVFTILERLAPMDVALTLIGEPGTGKRTLARGVHDLSLRAASPFVVFDCSAPPSAAIEGELFGSAHATNPAELAGAVGRADGGTLFLDQIGALPLEAQPRLIVAMENRRIRLVAATTRDLSLEVSHGCFRGDLYFRLASALVHVPPLSERVEDLPLIVEVLLSDLGRPDVRVEQGTLAALSTQPFPENIRDLKRTLARALEHAERSVLEPRHVLAAPIDEDGLEQLPLAGKRLDHIEKTAIKLTLAQCGGNKVQAARALGIAVSTLYEKLRRYGLTG